MGEIVKIVTQQQAEDAWQAYADHTRQAVDNPALFADRVWHEQHLRLYRAFNRIFYRICG